MAPDLIVPDWPAPASVRAFQTTRIGGFSRPPYDGLNLGDHVGDDRGAVAANRTVLMSLLPGEPLWLNQVHGISVADADVASAGVEADASIARQEGRVSVVMTADCLPILLCDRAGTTVAAVHGGWRSLAAGILEKTVAAMECRPSDLLAWLGPAIGPQAFEVGGEVRAAFRAVDRQADLAFSPLASGKWLADIWLLGRQRLSLAGVHAVWGGGLCTVTEERRFFSYRRDGITGRMGTFIWLLN